MILFPCRCSSLSWRKRCPSGKFYRLYTDHVRFIPLMIYFSFIFIIVIFVSLYLLLFWHNWILSLKPSSHLLIPFEIMSRNPIWPQFKKQEKIQREAFKRLHKWLGTSTVQFRLRTMHPFSNLLFHHDELELNSPFDSDC